MRPFTVRSHRRPPRALLGAALVFLLTAYAIGQAAPALDRDQAAVAAARRLMQSWMTETGAPGSQVTISRNGRTVWSEAFGFANLELQVPASPKTRFRIGSVSKPLTAAGLGLLVEEGKLDLDAPVQKYAPYFPEKQWPITPRQLAGHLAGIRHYKIGEFLSQRHFDTVKAGLGFFEKDPLLFEPGTMYAYSSYGFNLLSAAMEGASGEPFLAFMQKRVFEPVGMADTSPDDAGPIVPNRADFYTRGEAAGPIVNALYVDNSYKWAGGGFLSTTDDLVRFANAMMAGRFFKPETVKLLWTSQRTRDGKETEYGIGWGVENDEKGRRRISHSGGSQGGTANLILYPDEGQLAVAMLVNSDESFTVRAIHLATLFLEGEEGLRRWESREAGFALRYPESWAGRLGPIYLTGKDAAEQHPKAAGAARFRFMRSGGGRPEPVLTVLVFQSADWRALGRAGKPLPGIVLANRGGRTWVAVLPAENPYAAGTSDQRVFEEMRMDLAAIKQGFRLLN